MRVSMFWNFVIHQIFTDLLQRLEDVGTRRVALSASKAKQHAQYEIMKGLKDDENARQMVLKEEMKSLQMGSGSIVCSEASTGRGSGTYARPSALASRFDDIFLPRKMEFKGWVLDYKKCSYQGLAATEVSNFIRDLQKMMPDQHHKYTDWDQIRTEQGTWPTKSFINMWFKNETKLARMIGLLEIVKKESCGCPVRCMGRRSQQDWK